MTKRRLIKAVDSLDIKKKDLEYEIPGVLGFTLGGEEIVEVPTRDSFVYVRLRNNQNELIQAFNDQVSPVYDLPVLVIRDKVDKGRYKVVGRDLGQYQNWGSSSTYMARHGNQHSFNPDSGGGGDIVWVFGRQFMPLLGYPSGSNASGGIIIHSYTYYDGSSWNYVGNTGTVDLTTYKPTGSNARIVLVYINEYGNPDYRAGSFFNESITGTAEIVPYIPNPPTGTAFPVSAVRLVSGTSTISWGNLYDVRPFYDLSGTSSGLGGAGGGAPDDASYITLGLNGDLLAERNLITGTHTTITDGGANSTVAINVSPQGAGSGLDADTVDGDHATSFASGSHTHYQASILDLQHALPITEDSVFQATGTAIDFGENMNVDVTGSVVFVSSIDTVGGGGGGDLLIYDDSVFNVTGTAISFDDNLDVHVTGSIAYIEATGATGSAGAQGPAGDNTLLIYEDSVFEVTGTAINFEDNMDVIVTGSVAFVSSTGGSAEHSYFSKLASTLETDAIEPFQFGTFSYVFDEPKYLLASFQTQLTGSYGLGGRMEARNPIGGPLLLNNVTLQNSAAQGGAVSTAIILNPSTGTYATARETYYDRLDALSGYDTRYLYFESASETKPMLPGAYGAIITQVTDFNFTWLIGLMNTYGYNLENEIGDTGSTDYQRVGSNLLFPINKLVINTVRSGASGGTGTPEGGIVFVLLPSTWSIFTDPISYDLRDDFMGDSLATGTWTTQQTGVGVTEIDTLYHWCESVGDNGWDENGMYSVSSFSRSSGTVLQCDIFAWEEDIQANPSGFFGFTDGNGLAIADFSHAVLFGTGGTLSVYEDGNDRGTVGSGFTQHCTYRIKITLENNAAKYEIQGGTEYPAIGRASWENITPGTTSSSTTPLYAAFSNYDGTFYLSDIKVY